MNKIFKGRRVGFIFTEVLVAILIITSVVSTLFLVFKQYVIEKDKTCNFDYSVPLEVINRIILEGKSSGQISINKLTCYYESHREKIGYLTLNVDSGKQIELVRYDITCNGANISFFVIRNHKFR